MFDPEEIMSLQRLLIWWLFWSHQLFQTRDFDSEMRITQHINPGVQGLQKLQENFMAPRQAFKKCQATIKSSEMGAEGCIYLGCLWEGIQKDT